MYKVELLRSFYNFSWLVDIARVPHGWVIRALKSAGDIASDRGNIVYGKPKKIVILNKL